MSRAKTVSQWFDSYRLRPRINAIIEHLLPAQAGEYMILAGRTGIGKTNLALTLAYHIASGRAWEKFSVSQSRCLYLALEGDEGNLIDRAMKVSQRFGNVDSSLRCAYITRDNPRRMLEEIKGSITDEQVVIIDGGRLIMDRDYCKAKDTDSMVTDLMKWLTEKGLVAIITLQITKPGQASNRRIDADDVYNVKGATELVDSATSVLVLEKHKRTDLIDIYFSKHRIAAIETPNMMVEWLKDECRFKYWPTVQGSRDAD